MRILCVALAVENQFTPIFDRLKAEHEVALLAPPGLIHPRGMELFTFQPRWTRSGNTVARTREDFEATAAAVRDAVERIPVSFDVVFGQASWGCTSHLHELLSFPVVSHVELPGLEMKACRTEFPLSGNDQEIDRVRRGLVHGALQRSSLIITPSEYAQSLLPQDIQARVRPCMEGFPQEPFKSAAQRKQLRKVLNLPVERPIVGFFGRTLEAMRGFDIFIQAAKIIRSLDSRPVFLVVGEPVTYYGNEASFLGGNSFKDYTLEQSALSEEDFLFLPLQPLPLFRSLVATTDLAVFPIFENAGNWSFFEVLAAGTPVIAANCCFFPEVIKDGHNGFLCPVREAAVFADRALRLLSDGDLQERMRREAWKTVAQKYTVAHAAQRFVAVFQEAIQSKMESNASSIIT